MDVYKRLKIEFDSIDSTIREYTGNGFICNYLSKLETAIETGDKELMLYCLKAIDEWYIKNIDEIYRNEFVYDFDSHETTKALVHELYEEIQKAEPPASGLANLKSNLKTKVFISHSSADKKYGDAIRNFLVGLGLKNDQIVYSSYSANKIPVGVSIYDYLRDNINSNVFVIILLSNSFLNSVACLNEMGAAWVVKSDYLCFYVPDFDFSNLKHFQCAIDTRKMGAVLKPDSNCRASMIEFKDLMCNLFNLETDEKTSSSLIDEFFENIK